jgi:hypothetical protein
MKIGDKIYFEFKEHTIEQMDLNGIIKSVSDGYFSTHGNTLNRRCFPVNSNIKRISDRILSNYEIIRDAQGCLNLNFPYIHNKYVEYWVNALLEEDEQQKNTILATADVFTELLLDAIRKAKKTDIFGVYLFRQ